MCNQENPLGFGFQEAQKLCNLYKMIWTCHSSANRAHDQFFVLPRSSQDGSWGEGCRQESCTCGGSIPLLHSFFNQGLRPTFHWKGMRGSQSSLCSSNHSISSILLSGCSCVTRKVLHSHQEIWSSPPKIWPLLIYWISTRAGTRSPISLDQQWLGFTWHSQSGALQPGPSSTSGDNHLGLLSLDFLSSQISGTQDLSPLSQAVSCYKKNSMVNLHYEPLSLFLSLRTNFWYRLGPYRFKFESQLLNLKHRTRLLEFFRYWKIQKGASWAI